MKTKIRVELKLVVRAERQEDAIEFIRGELAKVPIARMAEFVTIEAGEKPELQTPLPPVPAPAPAPVPTPGQANPAEMPLPTKEEPVSDPGPTAAPRRRGRRKKTQPED